jgi:hypothetical protein
VLREPGVNERWRVLPDEAGDHAEGDGRQIGDGPVEQHGGCHLHTIPVAQPITSPSKLIDPAIASVTRSAGTAVKLR